MTETQEPQDQTDIPDDEKSDEKTKQDLTNKRDAAKTKLLRARKIESLSFKFMAVFLGTALSIILISPEEQNMGTFWTFIVLAVASVAFLLFSLWHGRPGAHIEYDNAARKLGVSEDALHSL